MEDKWKPARALTRAEPPLTVKEAKTKGLRKRLRQGRDIAWLERSLRTLSSFNNKEGPTGNSGVVFSPNASKKLAVGLKMT